MICTKFTYADRFLKITFFCVSHVADWFMGNSWHSLLSHGVHSSHSGGEYSNLKLLLRFCVNFRAQKVRCRWKCAATVSCIVFISGIPLFSTYSILFRPSYCKQIAFICLSNLPPTLYRPYQDGFSPSSQYCHYDWLRRICSGTLSMAEHPNCR